MMIFYNIKEYHVCFIHYIGGPNFQIEVFNPYCVPIDYVRNNNLEIKASPIPLEIGNEEFRKKLHVAKLFETFRYNAYYNCDEICRFNVDARHLAGTSYNEVYKPLILFLHKSCFSPVLSHLLLWWRSFQRRQQLNWNWQKHQNMCISASEFILGALPWSGRMVISILEKVGWTLLKLVVYLLEILWYSKKMVYYNFQSGDISCTKLCCHSWNWRYVWLITYLRKFFHSLDYCSDGDII